MSDTRIVTLDCLLGRLEALLGRNDLLFRRFERGLRDSNERCLIEAMNSLSLYPSATRQVVEDTVMSWLFGTRERAEEARRGASPRA